MRAARMLVTVVAALGIAGVAHAQIDDTVTVVTQTDGINSKRITKVALACHVACVGTLKLSVGKTKIGAASFSFPAKTTGHVPVKLSKAFFARLHKAKGRKMRVNLEVKGPAIGDTTSSITLKL